MLLPVTLVVVFAAAPQLESTAQLPPGPDGNVAAQGKLKKRFCFDAPAVCVPAGSEVLVTSNVRAKPRWFLQWVTPSKPLTLYGLQFAAEEKLQLLGAEVVGTLASPARVGPWLVTGLVRVTVKNGKADQLQRGTLASEGAVADFTLPAGCAFEPGDTVVSFDCPEPLRGVRRGDGWPHSARALRTPLRFIEGADTALTFSDAEPALTGRSQREVTSALFTGAPSVDSWRVAMGALTEPGTVGRLVVARGASVTWCRDGLAFASSGVVDGVPVEVVERVKRDGGHASSWAERCVEGDRWRGSATCRNAQGLPENREFELDERGVPPRRVCP